MTEALHPDLELVRAAAARDPASARTLVRRLTPIVQARVARCLLRSSEGRRRDVRQAVADLSQDTFRMLFEDAGRVLLRWSPERGLSLENFVGLVAHRHALSVLRSARRNPWSDEPVEDVERLLTQDVDAFEIVATNEIMDGVIDELRCELSPKGWVIFQRMLLDEEDIPVLVEELAMSRDALYAWRSRLGKVVRQKVAARMSGTSTPSRTSSPSVP